MPKAKDNTEKLAELLCKALDGNKRLNTFLEELSEKGFHVHIDFTATICDPGCKCEEGECNCEECVEGSTKEDMSAEYDKNFLAGLRIKELE